ncbi:MAG TPA: hypothetical protein VFU06_10020 [Longimicrobiales bacterium]|nr:hypothetical protein [Longimicrobiales bacterium]
MTRTSTKAAAEAALRELPSVVGAYVREDIFGHPREVHILVTAGPTPRELARDVRDLLEERLGVPVDQRVISIAQLACSPVEALPTHQLHQADAVEAAASQAGEPRLRLGGLDVEAGNGRVSVAARMQLGRDEHVGWGSEVETEQGRLRAGAAAIAQAVTLALGESGRLELEAASVVEAFGRQYGLICTNAASPRLGRHPIAMFGAHPLGSDPVEAGAYAALKSANRIVALLLRNGRAARRPRSR